MAGRRLLDVASLFSVAKGVTQKHAAIRRRQLDVFTRTSTLTKALKAQGESLSETASAASQLYSRLNETGPQWAQGAPVRQSSAAVDEAGHETVATQPQRKEGFEQDHFYEKSQLNNAVDPPPTDELEINQAEGARDPLPDGTVPPTKADLENLQRSQRFQERQKIRVEQPRPEGLDQDHFYTHSSENAAVDRLPTAELEIRQAVSEVDPLPDGTIPPPNAKYQLPSSSQRTRSSASTSEVIYDEIPEGVDLAVFHNPRIARQLGGRVQGPLKRDRQANAAERRLPTEPNILTLKKEAPTSPVIENESIRGTEQLKTRPDHETQQLAEALAADAPVDEPRPYQMRESRVPSSRLGRLWNYGGLAAGMFGGAISESFRRATGNGGEGSYMLSAGNIDRLVAKLSRMRGAALKLGQMISFQDSKMLPPAIQQVLQRVQDSADYMPASQRDKVLAANLGSNWRDLFETFEETPIAAASIGQVHRASLKSGGQPVAVKVQYPGVASSIDSDLNNLSILLTASRLLPKGLYLDKTIANARTELGWECDYLREAECCRRFQELLEGEEDVFVVPKVYPEASGKQVLTMSFMEGVGVTKVQNFSQEQRDWIGTQILRLCLREITEFRFMQTDPNWTNFLYNADSQKLELLDFGASREYPEEFISLYTRLLAAASRSDRETVRDLSIELGYLTGHESKAMLEAHLSSIMTLAEPFLRTSPEVYDFRDQTITERVKALIPVMLKERLAPPPEETYSLHRKLSGAFLLCARLGSRVRCRELFEQSMDKAGLS